MPFCENCGQKISDETRFCPSCGTKCKHDFVESNAQRRTDYEGIVYKCPNCGEGLAAFVLNCPACGYEVRGASNTSSIKSLVEKLQLLDTKRVPQKTGTVLLQALAGEQLSDVDDQKVSLIKNFPIPNTKEDIIEFAFLAASNINIRLYGMEFHSSQLQGRLVASQKAISEAWLTKLEQAYQKAQLLFGTTKEFTRIQALYNDKVKAIKRKKRQGPLILISIFASIFLLMGLIFLLLWLMDSALF